MARSVLVTKYQTLNQIGLNCKIVQEKNQAQYCCCFDLPSRWPGFPDFLTQVRIQDLVQGGPQLLRLKVADVAKQSRASEASNLRPGSRAPLRALEAFGFLMLKYAFSHILETLFLSFLTSILTPKVDKNRTLEFTSNILLIYYTNFLIFMKKLCFN